MRVVDMLNHGLSRMQPIRVRYVMHEEQQVVGHGAQLLIHTRELRWILADKARPGGARPVYPHTVVIRSDPLPPAIPLRRLDTRTVMHMDNVGKSANTQGPRIVLVDAP